MRGKGREEKRRKRGEVKQRTERLNAKYVREPPEKRVQDVGREVRRGAKDGRKEGRAKDEYGE